MDQKVLPSKYDESSKLMIMHMVWCCSGADDGDEPAYLSVFWPGIVLPPFFTWVNVPLPNHLSLASLTLAAALSAGVTISSPCTGVKDNDVEVPDAASLVWPLPSICVRILLARESLAIEVATSAFSKHNKARSMTGT